MDYPKCKMVEEGFKQGSCLTFYKPEGSYISGYLQDRACQVTLKWEGNTPYRLIKAILLSRPEDYLSIYQSGCNFSCLKCHSWEFSKYKNGNWMSPENIAQIAKAYAMKVTVKEPKERATSFHAHDLCKHCGSCVVIGRRSVICPNKLSPEQVLLSPQGYGPARNIVAFTGGDLTCNAEWYCQSAEKIKELNLDLRVLLETNGYGLTPKNLDLFKEGGVDSFWLDIKAWNNDVHMKLTGAENAWILRLPEEILKRDFTLEVLTLYIPGWVETDQIKEIAKHLAKTSSEIPFTILAFFGEYKLKGLQSPNLYQMLDAYCVSKEAGLKNIRMGNIHLFVKTDRDYQILMELAEEAI